MKRFFYILLSLLSGGLCAQTVTPQVLNTAGSHRVIGSTNATLSDNVGEPFTQSLNTGSSPMLTQGFIQPVSVAIPDFSVTAFKTDLTCSDKKDGRISTALTVALPYSYTVAYVWTPTVVCPGHNCSGIDSLNAGQYGLNVIFTYTNLAHAVINKTVTVPAGQLNVADANGPCKVKIFTGVSINGDGKNDHLFIENIEVFPNNRVTIYNRWGQQLYDEKGYDNTTKFWPSADEQSKLAPSTYFYILDLGDGSKPIKGWVELVKN